MNQVLFCFVSVNSKEYARLNFVVFNPEENRRSKYFQFKIFTEVNGRFWDMRQATLTTREFFGLILYHWDQKRSNFIRRSLPESSSSGNGEQEYKIPKKRRITEREESPEN